MVYSGTSRGKDQGQYKKAFAYKICLIFGECVPKIWKCKRNWNETSFYPIKKSLYLKWKSCNKYYAEHKFCILYVGETEIVNSGIKLVLIPNILTFCYYIVCTHDHIIIFNLNNQKFI